MWNRSCAVRSHPDRAWLAVALLLWSVGTTCAWAAQETTVPASDLRLDDVQQAVEELEADPNLGTSRTARTLRWITDDTPEQRRDRPGWVKWLGELLRWLTGSARLLVWVACALLAAVVVIFVMRLLRERSGNRAAGIAAAPTHVRDLDIRPESLPDDIGAAARQMWDAGEARRALALLYRGLLSKLAHDHRAPVRESTTEGDSVGLAQRVLTASSSAFAARLVQTWSHAVYGGLMPDTTQVHALCDGFAPALQPPPAAAPGDA
jgi:hypothetical protein